MRRHVAHAAATDLEHAINDAVDGYCAHNGVAASVVHGVWMPPIGIDASCLSGEDLPEHLGAMRSRRAVIVARRTPDQPYERSGFHIPHDCVETSVSSRGGVIGDCRRAVAEAFGPIVAWKRRERAMREAGITDGSPPPLWSLDIHPLMKALLPDLADVLGIDPDGVVATPRPEGGYVRPLVPISDSFRIDGSRIVPGMVRLAERVWLEQDATGLRVHLADRLPHTMLSGLNGRPIGEVLDATLVEDLAATPILAAIHHAGGTSLRVAPGWTPAAAHPDGDEAWRDAPSIPPSWNGIDEPFPKRHGPLTKAPT